MTLIESSPAVLRQVPACSETPANRQMVVWVRGEHDTGTAAALSEIVGRAIARDDADLVLDMSGVTFLDASTIGVVVRAHGHLRRRSRSLAVRSPSPCARRLLAICDLTELIDHAGRGRP